MQARVTFSLEKYPAKVLLITSHNGGGQTRQRQSRWAIMPKIWVIFQHCRDRHTQLTEWSECFPWTTETVGKDLLKTVTVICCNRANEMFLVKKTLVSALLVSWKPFPPQPSFFCSSGLTPWIPRTVYRYFWAYPFIFFKLFFCFPLVSCWLYLNVISEHILTKYRTTLQVCYFLLYVVAISLIVCQNALSFCLLNDYWLVPCRLMSAFDCI